MKTSWIRCVVAVLVIVIACLVGFVAWHPLLSIVFLGCAVLGMLFSTFSAVFAVLRKRKSDASLIFGSLAIISAFLFVGWFTRDDLMQDAMVAESARLVVRAEEFRKREGAVPESAAVLPPLDSSEETIAWIAGRYVQYLPSKDGFFVTRGQFISGEAYSSYTGLWEPAKI